MAVELFLCFLLVFYLAQELYIYWVGSCRHKVLFMFKIH